MSVNRVCFENSCVQYVVAGPSGLLVLGLEHRAPPAVAVGDFRLGPDLDRLPPDARLQDPRAPEHPGRIRHGRRMLQVHQYFSSSMYHELFKTSAQWVWALIPCTVTAKKGRNSAG